jgi:hypothetical protein
MSLPQATIRAVLLWVPLFWRILWVWHTNNKKVNDLQLNQSKSLAKMKKTFPSKTKKLPGKSKRKC